MVDSRIIKNSYIDWMCEMVSLSDTLKEKYSKLIDYIFEKPFEWPIEQDYNRAFEGSRLREVFCVAFDISIDEFYNRCVVKSGVNVSILEVLIALGVRCHDMSNPELAENTSWFMVFLKNLGLDCYDDSNFYVKDIDNILEKFVNRKYDKDGNGGLFPLKNTKKDQRSIELWYQMCFYLGENYAF
jgi:hypothetical protein